MEYDQIFTSQPLLAKTMENGQVKPWESGGENLEFILRTSGNDTFEARAYKTALDFKEADPLEFVELPSRFINGSLMYYDAQVESNQGKTKVVDLVETLVSTARDSAKTALAMELWQDGSDEHLHGIGAIFHHSNTYMGKDRTATGMEYWKSRVSDAGHTSFTQTHADGTSITYGPYHTAEPLVVSGGTDGGISKLYDDLCDNGGADGPDFAMTINTLFRKLSAVAKAEGFGYNEKMAQLGWPENLQYRNMVIVWDWNATNYDAGPFIACATKYLQLKPYMGYDTKFKSTPTIELYSQGLWAKAKMMQWRGNLACVKPQKTGALTGKTV
jgi:hypothetical protein